MTVAELIEKLKTFPPDYPVIYALHSDYALMEIGNVMVQHATSPPECGQAIYHHNIPGELRRRGFSSDDSAPPVSCVIFPGN